MASSRPARPSPRSSLRDYRHKRDPARTPEPVPGQDDGPLPRGNDDTFVIQEHHARALHWDLRLERDGVLVSWAVPKGLPADPATNHLAVHTEDHPLEYATFAGDIPAGEYGGGRMTIWDRGTYDTEKWTDREVKVVLHGERVQGRYVLFATGGRARDWMVHRMDPPSRADWEPLPRLIRPMLAVPGQLPPEADDDRWAYEFRWDGLRAIGYAEGGRLRLVSGTDTDLTRSFPEARGLAEALGARPAVLDGELVSFDAQGRQSLARLQERTDVHEPAAMRRLVQRAPVVYLVFDVLHLDGRSLLDLPYRRRRELLDGLDLAGPAWRVPPSFTGGGADVLAASRENGLPGVVAKQRDAPYRPGRRSRDWRTIKHVRTQEVVVVGWRPGKGGRAGSIGALVLAVPGQDGLEYAGAVGAGFTEQALAQLRPRLIRLARTTSPLDHPLPSADTRDVRWVTPRLVGEVAFTGWTRDGRLRHPAWRGLRPETSPAAVRTDPLR
jgi:bifunctional non-homologous end joining protein LigD